MVSSEKTPKVFLLSSTLATGGAEKVLESLAKGLPKHDFLPHTLCLHDLGKVGEEIRGLGQTVHSGLSTGRFDPLVFFRLLEIFRRDRGALLFTLDHHDAIFWGGLASIFSGIKHRVMSVHSTGLWAKGGSFNLSDRVVLPYYDRIVALADLHADYLEKREGIDRERIEIISNGVDTERFHPLESEDECSKMRERFSLSTDDFVVTIVAALRPEKNHEMFLRSAAAIRARGKDFTYLVIGEGKESRKLEALARNLSLDDVVRFMGLRSDIPEILSISDVSVLCSHPVVETFPLSVLEAMASGIPVVATSVGSIPVLIEDTEEGILIPTGDEGALTEALLFLERDTAGRKRMGERARKKVVRRFSEEHMVEEYANLFSNLLGAGKKGQ